MSTSFDYEKGRHFVHVKRDGSIELQQIPTGKFIKTIAKGYNRNHPCPCGSGKKFKKCCWTDSGEYEKFED